jgi:hypothetical protein
MKMNLRILTALATLAMVRMTLAGTATFYVNDGLIVCPPQVAPQVDALNFINNSLFVANSTNLTYPYWTANTVTYTNVGTMTCDNGFTFARVPASGMAEASDLFFNSGVINSGTNANSFTTAFGLFPAQTLIYASTVFTPGTINLGGSTLLSVRGDHLDFTRSTVQMLGFGATAGPVTDGLFDGYWGVGTNRVNPYLYYGYPLNANPPPTNLPPTTPAHAVTRRDQSGDVVQLELTNFTYYAIRYLMGGSNLSTYAVFLRQNDPSVTNYVYFPGLPREIIVEWNYATTNEVTGVVTPHSFYLIDDFAANTNLGTIVTGTFGGLPTERPVNYEFTYTRPFYLDVPPEPYEDPTGWFANRWMTNDFAAYQALFAPFSTIPGEIYGQDVTNMPGRVEIFASRTLNLERSRIGADNFMILSCTNHYLGSPGAQISSPIIELNLATTNGFLTVSNLITPSMPRPEGPISLYTMRWDEDLQGYSNRVQVLFVDSDLRPFSRPTTANATLRATNVTICDFMNVRSNLLITARNLTVATNNPGGPTPYGAINLVSGTLLWPTAFPTLERLTNYGIIQSLNAAYFGGARTTEFYNSNFYEPYQAIVNHGLMQNQGVTFWARDFISDGTVDAGLGSILLTSSYADLDNSIFRSSAGDVSLSVTGRLAVSNFVLTAGRTLTISGPTWLDDGSMTAAVASLTNRNAWQVGNGVKFLTLPPSSSLLGTTITSTAPANTIVSSIWPGLDGGTNFYGYQNNAALGRLVLSGATNCSFAFAGITGGQRALYVDRLELEGYASAKDANNDLKALAIAGNFRIYYGDALVDGVSQAEKLDGHNDGRLVWVSSYAGYYSSTNIIYPNGTTNAVNSALAASCQLDSDNDGLINCIDPTPIPVAGYCTTTLSQTNASFAFEGGTGSFSVQDTNFCGYTAFSSNSWLTIIGGSSGNGFGQIFYQVATNYSSGSRTGLLYLGSATFTVTQTAGGWVTSPIFGQLYYAGEGWYGGSAYGWMWDDPNSDWIWSTALQGWLATTDPNSRTLWSAQFRWLTPSQTDLYQAETSTLGVIYVGQYQGSPISEGWVVSPRYGYVWAAGDGTWFYTTDYGWLGVLPDGGIWCVDQNRFL